MVNVVVVVRLCVSASLIVCAGMAVSCSSSAPGTPAADNRSRSAAAPDDQRDDQPGDLPPAAADAGMHAPLDRLLRASVRGSTVRYSTLSKHAAVLDGYLATLADTDPSSIDGRDAQLAFWINAYNAFTLKLILEHYPGIESILHIDDGKTWKVARWIVGGTTYSLDQIEHEVIRADFHEPRIHFAVNCASGGCPDLRAEAFVGPRLETQLAEQTVRFLADTSKGVAAETKDGTLHLHVTKLFEWFADDFRTAAGSVVGYIREHAPAELQQEIAAAGEDTTVIDYLEYDWTLNGD